ncbi:helix-turn-helix domain-containing protein [Streptomyces halobius]|uniref:Helix-turn-helix domain-containing protein n=1 Tax=Streptomyces halobius TaxID=2879846 RepID=A0ABY4M193_9ACTN|nr:helix-turn-helix transcriptional regulator [Streptomyces halobius]UQA91539.1 helix-turn-helix domain-containing protein [Streptomyces halobius]
MTQRDFDDGFHDEYEDEDDVPAWADQVQATVAAEVRRRRKELRMSAQDLADACAEIGYPIPRNVIANMESGRRAVIPLVEVMVLAKALRIPPVCLLYPIGYVDQVHQLPFQAPVSPGEAMAWFTGNTDDRDTKNSMLSRFRAHARDQRAALAALEGEKRERWNAETAATSAERDEAQLDQADYAEMAVLAKYRLRQLRIAIREGGATPPHLPTALADVDPLVGNTTEEDSL